MTKPKTKTPKLTPAERDLHKGTTLRAKAKSLEDEAKSLKKQADPLIYGAFAQLGTEKASIDGLGTVSARTTTRTTIDKDRLKEELLLAGVDAHIVLDCFAKASKESTSTYIEFRSVKPS